MSFVYETLILMSFRHETWTEKYRPKTIDDMVGNTEIISTLKRYVKDENLPHLFFSGPAGVGKTSAIQALICDIYGREYRELQRAGLVLESNASTLNRIIHIRDRQGRPGLIKRFMMSAVPTGKSFKFLILDEAERLVDPAQHAMRRLMELYYRTCKVCIICNEPEKIIDYLRSRCSVFNFRPIKHEEMKRGLRRIITTENLKINDLATDLIIKTSKGDLRKAINILQTAATTETIKPESIYTALNQFQSDRIKKMFYSAVQGQFLNADELLRELLKDNFPKEEILNIISSEIPRLKLRTKLKTELFEAVANTDYIITQSTNTDLQISSLLGKIALIGQRANMTSSPFHGNQDLS